jgi:hypothetical protein
MKVNVPEPKGRGVISISNRRNGPITVRQNGKTRVYHPVAKPRTKRNRPQRAATRRDRQEPSRDVRWRTLLRLLESGDVPIHPRLNLAR